MARLMPVVVMVLVELSVLVVLTESAVL